MAKWLKRVLRKIPILHSMFRSLKQQDWANPQYHGRSMRHHNKRQTKILQAFERETSLINQQKNLR